jgi:hypothetical protein
MFSVEYKPGVSQGGSVICPISFLTMSQALLGNLIRKMKRLKRRQGFLRYALRIFPNSSKSGCRARSVKDCLTTEEHRCYRGIKKS